MHILVVGGPLAAGKKIVEHLRSGGHQAECADTGEDAFDLVQRYEFDAAVIALDLPDMRGADLIRCVRAARVKMPLLALSPTPYATPRIAALKAGADDAMAMPFDEDELGARLQAMVRRSRGHSHHVLNAGPVSVDFETHEVAVNGRLVHLTMKEVTVLELLMLRCNTPVAKEIFLSQLYADADQEPDPKIVDVFVCKIRRKLAVAGAPDVIGTVWGRGYVMRSMPNRQEADATLHGTVTSFRPVSEMA